jgi:iron(III) transport system substrate-binding protein
MTSKKSWARSVAAALALVAAPALAQAPSGKLVLYTSQPERDASRTLEGFRTAHPGVEVEVFRSGTTEVINRLQAEFAARDPKPDLLLIADAVTMTQLKRDGRLAAHPGADVAAFDPSFYDRDKTFFGTKVITTGIVVHRDAPFQPQGWADLVRAEARGQVILPSPLYSGAAVIHMGAVQAADGLGPQWFDALAKLQPQAVRGNGAVLQAVAQGQRAFGVVVDFMALNAQRQGSPVRFLFPREGVSVVTEPVAILSSAKNQVAARAFVDWILSEAGQKTQVSLGNYPARRGVTPPEGFPSLDGLKLLPMDVERLIRDEERNKERFAELFGR